MISAKRKRKLVYKDKLYYWFVKLDEYYGEPYLTIISEDKKLYLNYLANQISDDFSYPKISVLKSDKMQKGTYFFSPPLADETISAHHIGAILNWHDTQNEDIKPIKQKALKNPFENIDFKNGTVTHIENDFSRESLREDMLQVSYPKNYLLDVGWYGSSKGFRILIIKNQNWETPVAQTQKGVYQLHEAILRAIEIIEQFVLEQ
ncbi:hypothetical protein ACFFLS_04825 [Flavobacterium procerum]|uniref:Uncharacterized protein n=1 Tax=Flavobacterium procerum TaxID=1455569 RepID=A0ABV6BLP3_9FLAO